MYKVGDLVRILPRQTGDSRTSPHYVQGMIIFARHVYKVKKITPLGTIRLQKNSEGDHKYPMTTKEVDIYSWHKDWLEPVVKQEMTLQFSSKDFEI